MAKDRGGRGRGRGKDGKQGSLPRDVLVSKKLSWLLRHGAKQEGLKLGAGAYVNVGDVLNCRVIRSLNVTLVELRTVVADSEKQRFSLIPDPAKSASAPQNAEPETDDASAVLATKLTLDESVDLNDPRNYLIRANQGHSLPIDSAELLIPITEDNMPHTVVHGTSRAAWPRIVAAGGLSKMSRNHIHFAAGLPKGFRGATAHLDSPEKGSAVQDSKGKAAEMHPETPVLSGMRLNSTVLIYIDVPKAMAEGFKFWLSDNGVILTEGDEKGFLGTSYFRRVEEVSGQGKGQESTVLMKDGIKV